jgi:hypothetical protein
MNSIIDGPIPLLVVTIGVLVGGIIYSKRKVNPESIDIPLPNTGGVKEIDKPSSFRGFKIA